MKHLMYILSLCILLGIYTNASAQNPKEIRQKLLAEIQLLKEKEQTKLDELEVKEAYRWQDRYKQSEELKSLEERSKVLNTRYSRLAEDLTRKQETKLQAEERTQRLEEDLDKRKQVQDRLYETVQQEAEKIAGKLSQDFPYGISKRTLLLSQTDEELNQRNMIQGMGALFQERFFRLSMTQTQTLETKATLWGDEEKTVWQMRLGTLMLYELSKDSEETQALLRTGALQGKTFTWRQDLTDEFASAVSSSIYTGVQLGEKAQDDVQQTQVPMDVLQNRGIGIGYTKKSESGIFASLSEWFAKGGVVMYPLLLCALAALLLVVERFLVYRRRETKLKHTKEELLPMIFQKRYNEAAQLCAQKETGLAKAIASVLHHRESGREQAEKSVKEALSVEVPFLEKRLSFISALGASAPLLGLLGTVSGMITLFQVITDVGTNDARILAGGISEALVTTQTGLIVAIPILVLHGYLSEKLDGITSSLQEVSLDALNAVWPEEGKSHSAETSSKADD